MAVTPASFRTNFPAFKDQAVYPDEEIQFWIALGTNLINLSRWGNLADYGLQLFVAHNLALSYMSQTASAGGQAPGQVSGPVTSASVDKVSYSRDPSSAMDPKNGHWNLTTYGLRYIRLVMMIGAGPVQVGAPFGPGTPGGPQGDGGAWPGVQNYYPFTTGG